MQENKKKSLKSISRSAFWTFWGILASNIIGYFYRIPLARLLGTHAYGLFCLGTSLLGLLYILSLLGLSDGLVRTVAVYQSQGDHNKVKNTIKASFVISLVASILLMLLILQIAPFIAVKIFHNKQFTTVLRLFALLLPVKSTIVLLTAVFRSFHKITLMVFFEQIAEKAFRTLFILLFLIIGFRLYGAVFGFILAATFTLLAALFAYKKNIIVDSKNGKGISDISKELLRFSIPLLFSGFLYTTAYYFDTFCLGFFRDAKSVGVYNAVANLALFLIIFSTSIASLQLPVISKLWAQNDRKEIKKIYTAIVNWILITSLPACIICSFFSKKIILLTYGEPYIDGWKVFIIFLIGIISRSWIRPAGHILTSAGKTRVQLQNMILTNFINIILNIILIPHYGMEGAAVATLISFSFYGIVNTLCVYKILKMHPFSLRIIKIVLSAGIAFPILFFSGYSQFHSLLSAIFSTVCYLAAYYFVLSLLGGLKEENKLFVKLMRNITKQFVKRSK